MSAVLPSPPVTFNATIAWPVRPNIRPLSCSLQDKYVVQAAISFPPTYAVASGISLSGVSWTRVDIEWKQPFLAGDAAADAWSRSKSGQKSLIAKIESISAALIDALRAIHSTDRNLAGLRSFGIRDWPYFDFGIDGFPKQIRIGVHAEHQFRSVSSDLFFGAPVSLLRSTSFSARALLRASDMAESGYPTEAVLIAFGALDTSVQDFLVKKMLANGMVKDAAISMLRNITTKRLSTYLDSVLMLVCGRTIAENGMLLKSLSLANRARNDAIHNGFELDRTESIEIIECISDVFAFLQSIDSDFEPSFIRPTFFSQSP